MDHELLTALEHAAASGDLDGTLSLGLLDDVVWHDLQAHASPLLVRWRTERLAALQARERFRAKQAREQAKAEALRRKREGAKAQTAAALPNAALDALARAKARAAAKRS